MTLFRRAFLALTATLGLSAAAMQPAYAADLENTLYLQLKDGRVVIELRPDLAPVHVARIKELARQGFYDGLVFHRVIDGFMAQTGDPKGDGTGGSGKKLPDEFSSAHFLRGTLGAASAGPNTSDSQFFICFKASTFLDNQYTIFGQVTEGMEFVDKIKRGDDADNGKVTAPDKIVSLKVAADVEKGAAAPAPAKQ